jgi:hypothetical protein
MKKKNIYIDKTPVYTPVAPFTFSAHFKGRNLLKESAIMLISSLSTEQTSLLINTYRNRGTHEKIWWGRPMYFPLNRTFPDVEG